jgi:transposase
MSKQVRYDNEFKQDVVKYALEHPEMKTEEVAKKFGIGKSTVDAWKLKYKKEGVAYGRGSGNYESEEAKENARLRKELKDTKDALEILKKAIGILG